MDLRRRDVLKIMGLSVAASAVPGCKREAHNLVPYLLPDEEIVPGVANWYSSLCRECEAGCGTIVRVMEGRAKKIEGNPDHPLNQGKLCARGQAAVQALYNPDRLKTPLRRTGDPGSGQFEPLEWAAAIEHCAELLRHSPKSLLIGRARPGSESMLLAEFMAALNGTALFFSPEETVSLRVAARETFGIPQVPRYDLAQCDYLLSLGAPFLEHWVSPVALNIGYGEMRQGRPTVRGRVVQVESRMSVTGANADRWLPIRPGTEGVLTMGLAQLVLRSAPARVRHATACDGWLDSLSIEQVAQTTEIPERTIRQVADELLGASAPLVLAGGMAAGQTNGTATMRAVLALNAMLGAINRPGGAHFMEPPKFAGGPTPVGERDAIAALNAVSEARGMVVLHDLDLLHLIPPSFNLRDRLESAGAVVVLNSMLDDTALFADLVLPLHTSLEAWGDQTYDGQTGRPVIGLQQPVVHPLYETKALGDVILEVSARLGPGVKTRLPWPSFHAYLEDRWRHAPDLEHDAVAWQHYVRQGGWWGSDGRESTIDSPVLPPLEAAKFEGDIDEYPFFFYPFPSLGLHRGEGANRPWLQQLPDPLTTVMWGSWVEINPMTATQLGLNEGDLARVISPYDRLEAPVVYSQGIRPDLIAMPMGQGHRAFGRYAAARGVNPLDLLAPVCDHRSGRLASGATRVRIERTGRRGRLVRAENPERQSQTDIIHIERLRRRI